MTKAFKAPMVSRHPQFTKFLKVIGSLETPQLTDDTLSSFVSFNYIHSYNFFPLLKLFL